MSYDASADDDREVDGGASPVYDYSNEEDASMTPAAIAPTPAAVAPQSSSTRSVTHTATTPSTAAAAASSTSSAAVQRTDSVNKSAPRWPISFSSSQSSQHSSASKKGGGSASKRKMKVTGPAAKSRGSASQQMESAAGSRFVQCPACERTLPHFELDAHLESCGLGTSAATSINCSRGTQPASQATQSSAKKRKTDSTAPSAGASGDKGKNALSLKMTQEALAPRQNGSSFGPCLFGCGMSVILANMSHHMDLECRNRPNKKAAAASAAAAAASAAPIPAAPAAPPAPAAPATPPADVTVTAAAPPSLPLESAESLVIPESEPVLLIESTQEPMDDGSQPDTATVAAAAASAATPAFAVAAAATPASAAAVTPHAFFTSGPRAAAAFVPQRRGRNDHVKCSLLVHFTACCAAEAAASSSASPAAAARSPGTGTGTGAGSVTSSSAPFMCEWQDVFEGSSASPASSSSPAATSHTPSQCSIAQLSPLYHSHTKYVESAAEGLGTDVHLHASTRFLDGDASASPVMDFTSESLVFSPKHRGGGSGGRRFNLTLSQLKSLLQKNIRLSRPAAAVRSAFQLMSVSVIEFLRRFSIIMLEDAVLHPSLPCIVWLTGALGKKSGFVLRQHHVETLLAIVHEVASVGVKDALQEHEGGAGVGEPPQQQHDDEEAEEESKSNVAATPAAALIPDAAASAASSSSASFSPSSLPPPTLHSPLPDLDPAQRALVKCLLLRACMGGSAWDVRMMRSYAALWNRRFHAENFVRRRLAEANAAATPSKSPAQSVPPSPATSSLLSPASGSWLSFLGSLYAPSSSSVPPALRWPSSLPIRVREVQPIQDEDLVLSAVDQHCSNIVSHTANCPISRSSAQLATAMALACHTHCSRAFCFSSPSLCVRCQLDRVLENPRVSGPLRVRASELGVSAADLLPQLMWTFRSSLTNKHDLRPATKHMPEDAANARLFARIKGEIDAAAKKILAARIQN